MSETFCISCLNCLHIRVQGSFSLIRLYEKFRECCPSGLILIRSYISCYNCYYIWYIFLQLFRHHSAFPVVERMLTVNTVNPIAASVTQGTVATHMNPAHHKLRERLARQLNAESMPNVVKEVEESIVSAQLGSEEILTSNAKM